MEPLEMTILDVGHGSCSLIVDGEMVFVVDTPIRNRMLNLALADKGISQIDAILISHGDADHIGGVLSLLANSSLAIDRVFVNPEMKRDTTIWKDLRAALRDARNRGEVRLSTELTMETADQVQLPRLDVEILAPSPENAMSGAGGLSVDGRRLTANSMSAVIRLRDENSRGVLLTGDIDQVGLEELLRETGDLEADVLVFPHHGGLPGRDDPEEFAHGLVNLVGPDTVVFSLSRASGLPRPEVVRGVRASGADPHIACTQLSRSCAELEDIKQRPYLSDLSHQEGTSGRCCAGPVEIRFTEAGLFSPQLAGHADFVNGLPKALCQA